MLNVLTAFGWNANNFLCFYFSGTSWRMMKADDEARGLIPCQQQQQQQKQKRRQYMKRVDKQRNVVIFWWWRSMNPVR